jgi:chemotaxis protein histidine kinase CheA
VNPKEFQHMDKTCVHQLTAFCKEAEKHSKDAAESCRLAINKLDQDLVKLHESLRQSEKELELIEMLCQEKMTALNLLNNLDKASKDEAMAQRHEEEARKREHDARLLEEKAKSIEKQAALALKDAQAQKQQAHDQEELAKKQAEKARIKLEEAKQKAKLAHKDAKKAEEQEKMHADMKKSAAKKDREIARLKKHQKAMSFDEGLKRLKKNMTNLNKYTLDERKLMHIIARECDTIATTDNEASKRKLAHTLKVINDFVEEDNIAKRNYDALSSEAAQYVNSKRKSLQRLSAGMIVLGIISIAAVVTISALTFGVGLVPATLVLAAIVTATLATLTVGSGIGCGYSLFAAKQPKIHRALKHCAKQDSYSLSARG